MRPKNILFDLGGVIYDIDPQLTQNAIQALLPSNELATFYSKTSQISAISDYEMGKMDTPTFIRKVKEELGLEVHDKVIADAWNALLVGLVEGRVAQIQSLKGKYNLALLSNTNDLHFTYIQKDCQPIYDLMDRCFFSFLMGMRKPNADIFEKVLTEMNWKREETLFIEDSPPNILGAEAIGLPVFPIRALSDFEELMVYLS